LIKRKKIFNNYDKLLKKIDRVSLLPSNNWSENSYWLYTITLDNNKIRNYVVSYLQNIGIDVRPSFYPLNLMPPYKKFAKSKCKISQKIGLNGLSLPSSNISFNEQKYIVEKLILALQKKLN